MNHREVNSHSSVEATIAANAPGKNNESTDSTSFDRSPGVLESFGSALVYSGIQEPYRGVRELVNHVASSNVLPEVHIVDRPAETQFGSVAWHAQAIGSGVGMLAPLALLKGTIGRGAGSLSLAAEARPLAGVAGRIAATKTPILESLATGAAYEGLLRPVGDTHQFWQQRAINTAIGGVTFGAMHKASQLMGDVAVQSGKSIAEKAISGARNGVVAGAVGGAVNHEAHAIAHGYPAFDAQGLAKSAYSFAFPGMAMGGMHATRAQRIRNVLNESQQSGKFLESNETVSRRIVGEAPSREFVSFIDRHYPNRPREYELGRSAARQLTPEERKSLGVRPGDSVRAMDLPTKDGKTMTLYY